MSKLAACTATLIVALLLSSCHLAALALPGAAAEQHIMPPDRQRTEIGRIAAPAASASAGWQLTCDRETQPLRQRPLSLWQAIHATFPHLAGQHSWYCELRSSAGFHSCTALVYGTSLVSINLTDETICQNYQQPGSTKIAGITPVEFLPPQTTALFWVKLGTAPAYLI